MRPLKHVDHWVVLKIAIGEAMTYWNNNAKSKTPGNLNEYLSIIVVSHLAYVKFDDKNV